MGLTPDLLRPCSAQPLCVVLGLVSLLPPYSHFTPGGSVLSAFALRLLCPYSAFTQRLLSLCSEVTLRLLSRPPPPPPSLFSPTPSPTPALLALGLPRLTPSLLRPYSQLTPLCRGLAALAAYSEVTPALPPVGLGSAFSATPPLLSSYSAPLRILRGCSVATLLLTRYSDSAPPAPPGLYSEDTPGILHGYSSCAACSGVTLPLHSALTPELLSPYSRVTQSSLRGYSALTQRPRFTSHSPPWD